MYRTIQLFALFSITLFGIPRTASAAGASTGKIFDLNDSAVMQAEAATIDSSRAQIVAQASFESRTGVALKPDAPAHVGKADSTPDLVFRVRAHKPGRYVIRTCAAVDARGAEQMRRARSKYDSMRLMIAVGQQRPTERVVFVPWRSSDRYIQTTGKFDFVRGLQEIRIWLPAGLRLDYLKLSRYTPPRVPAAAVNYKPPIVPPATHPRLWVNAQTLPQVRANLTKGENAPLWKQVKSAAARPVELHIKSGIGSRYDPRLEKAVVAKAFVYLMSGNQQRGREAVELTQQYLSAVEFGNLLDITREIGRAIYAAALVYDWCYDLMTPAQRDSIRHDLMRLADDMEIGWPPFRQMIVNGHGNEAQVNRDLLSMAIAVYDEDPVPYRYCAYRILEELVPMRRFEYQSPRHNQGVSYGPYRFGWDMHAAWLFYRMTGKHVFDDNIMQVGKFWLYMRLPNGETLRDGDGFSDGRPAKLGATALLCAAYANDPVMKGDFLRQGGLPQDPILVLLLNDPKLKAATGFDSLPLTIDFGPILGSMVARTGWTMGPTSADVVVEMKGGGYQFNNHQHADAGSFQIYYHGLQAVDLGQYHFYGTPYDYNFNKRSIAHSMLLVVDPNEKFPRNLANDGGTRFVRSCPRTPKQVQTNPLFANGTIVSADFGVSRQRPSYSYFSVNLTSAYSEKIRNYVRTFCFLNLNNSQTPASLIILDNVTAAKPEFRKYWQVNTLNPPQATADGVTLHNQDFGHRGNVVLRMLRPLPSQRTMKILSGKEANSVFGKYFDPPKPDRPEANGHRIMFSPTKAQANDVFLTVMTMCEPDAPELPIDLVEQSHAFVLTLADRIVVLNKTARLLNEPLQIEVKRKGTSQLLATGLAPGTWTATAATGGSQQTTRVEKHRNTAFFTVSPGVYTLRSAKGASQ